MVADMTLLVRPNFEKFQISKKLKRLSLKTLECLIEKKAIPLFYNFGMFNTFFFYFFKFILTRDSKMYNREKKIKQQKSKLLIGYKLNY